MIGRLLCWLGCHKWEWVSANLIWTFARCARPGCIWESRVAFPRPIGGLVQRPTTSPLVRAP
jgi:hypothetical protein